jgi:hypothetical protein
LFGSSSSSGSSDEDESSDDEEDDEERADDATAPEFMKSLGMGVYTSDEGADELARSKFEAGAASAASGVLSAFSYVYGYANAVGSYSESASGGAPASTCGSLRFELCWSR